MWKQRGLYIPSGPTNLYNSDGVCRSRHSLYNSDDGGVPCDCYSSCRTHACSPRGLFEHPVGAIPECSRGLEPRSCRYTESNIKNGIITNLCRARLWSLNAVDFCMNSCLFKSLSGCLQTYGRIIYFPSPTHDSPYSRQS